MNRINRKSGFTLVELLICFVICAIVFVMIFGVVSNGLSTSDGTRVGVLSKFSYSGLVNKSYEGELNMGGVRNRVDSDGKSSMVANVWEFSCTNPDTAKKIESLIGKEVIIKYHQSFGGFSRRTSYDVVSIEEVKHQN
jgi:hypothetical protein